VAVSRQRVNPSRNLKLQNRSVGNLRLLFQHLDVYYICLLPGHLHRIVRNISAKIHFTLSTIRSIKMLTYYTVSTNPAGVTRKLKIIVILGEKNHIRNSARLYKMAIDQSADLTTYRMIRFLCGVYYEAVGTGLYL
jgi:hypothetical protein